MDKGCVTLTHLHIVNFSHLRGQDLGRYADFRSLKMYIE